MPYEDLHADYTPEIVAPVDFGDLMWAAASYIFWPILPIPMLFTARREQPYLRFHFVQSLLFGIITTIGFSIFTLVLVLIYRGVGSPDSMGMAVVLIALWIGWLFGMLFAFAWFLIFAWRAGRGDVFRVVIIGGLVENWVLSGMRPTD